MVLNEATGLNSRSNCSGLRSAVVIFVGILIRELVGLRLTIFNGNLVIQLKLYFSILFPVSIPFNELSLFKVLFCEKRIPKYKSLFVSYYFSKTI